MSIFASNKKNRILASLLISVGTLFLVPARGLSQTNAAMAAGVPSADGKPFAFEVVSIRQTKTPGRPNFGATPDGFKSNNLPLMVPILMANLPASGETYYTSDRIKGAPDWVTSDQYSIDARISEADMGAWQKPDQQKVMLPAMLNAMLVERCKLAVHRETKESAVFDMQVGKGGAKLKESAPDAQHAAGISLPAGGTLVPGGGGRILNFYGATMASLAQVLSNFSGRPVKDMTGLTGKYDFTLERSDADVPTGGMAPGDPGPPAYAVDALGLHLERSKSMVDTLVIDHIERPSEN